MSWLIVPRPEAEIDIASAAAWDEERQVGLGGDLIREAISIAISENPFLNSRKHPRKAVRWRVTRRFPYRVIYEVIEDERCLVVLAVLHAARHNRRWQKRLD